MARLTRTDLASLMPFGFVEGEVAGVRCTTARTGYAGVTPALHSALEERFHVRAREVYGMTEIGLGTFVPFEDEHMVGSGSMGCPPAFRQLKIVDEQGNEVPQGQTGEIIVKGQGVFKGYYKKPEENAKAFFGEYFRTGDLAYVDKNGYFFFVGRKKDMIRRMGDNISALEVEFALESHPKIAEPAVIGVPDEIRDEEVKAYYEQNVRKMGLQRSVRASHVFLLIPDGATPAEVQRNRMAVIATAPGRDCDFVSRFFVTSLGIPEDPVTGSANCTLVPYWSKRLAKSRLFARQVSSRGGELWCEDRGERVNVAGRCAKYLEGTIELPDA